MATTWTTTGSSFLITGTKCSVTEVMTRDTSNKIVSAATPLIGCIYNQTYGTRGFLCMRMTVVPTESINQVTVKLTHQNKAHGYDDYVYYYAKAGGGWPDYNDTSETYIGKLPTSGSFTFTCALSAATSSAFYVYVWGYLPSDSIGEHDQKVTAINSVVCSKAGANVYVKTGSSTWTLADEVLVKTGSSTWTSVESIYAKTASSTWSES